MKVTLSHPICYDSYNICEVIADPKLSNCAIQMLQNIYERFETPITDIKVKRKAPYIERLITLSKKCTCQGNFKLRFVKTISVMCWNICLSERLAYEGQPINIGIIIVKSTALYSKRLIENSTREIVFDCLFLIL